MVDLSNLPPLRALIREAGLQADKKFGQNFLLDLNITRKIVRLAHIKADDHVIEIGPGPGGLTRALLETGALVTAYELDARVGPILAPLLETGKLGLRFEDALKADWRIIPEGTKIVANLPYNIATLLIIKWLRLSFDEPPLIASMNLMVQHEVAERICAKPSCKDYGRLSVMAQWLMSCQICMTLPPSAFTPPPKVHSSIIRFTPEQARLAADFDIMEKLVATAFNQRRKMIRSSLSSYHFDWEALGIDPQKRAEDLSVENYVFLSNNIKT